MMLGGWLGKRDSPHSRSASLLHTALLCIYLPGFKTAKCSCESRARKVGGYLINPSLRSISTISQLGVPRSEVTKYLESRKIVYRERRRELAVNLGEQPDVFPCDRWAVYVSLNSARISRGTIHRLRT